MRLFCANVRIAFVPKFYTSCPDAFPSNVAFSLGGGELPGATEEHRRKPGEVEALPLSSGTLGSCDGVMGQEKGQLCVSICCFGFGVSSMVDILYALSEKENISPQHFVYIFTILLEMFIVIVLGRLKNMLKFCSLPI